MGVIRINWPLGFGIPNNGHAALSCTDIAGEALSLLGSYWDPEGCDVVRSEGFFFHFSEICLTYVTTTPMTHKLNPSA